MANKHAIVIGGSMAGLCAARVLCDFFERVTVIDRDSFPDGALERAGVPQSRHVHALLARGRIELDNLFPGFEQTMIERGVHVINFGLDFATLRGEGWGTAPARPDHHAVREPRPDRGGRARAAAQAAQRRARRSHRDGRHPPRP